MSFAQRLRELRMNKGLSQIELAKKLKISNSTISMYERGERQPSYEALMHIANTFGVSPAWLMNYKDDIHDYTITDDGLVTDDKLNTLTDEQLVGAFNMLTPAHKDVIKRLIYDLISAQVEDLGLTATSGIAKEAVEHVEKERQALFEHEESITDSEREAMDEKYITDIEKHQKELNNG